MAKRFYKILIILFLFTFASCTTTLSALDEKKVEAKSNLETLVDINLYSLSNQGVIRNFINDGERRIDLATSIAEINQIFDETKSNILAIKLLTEELELNNYRTGKITELNDYINTRQYTEDNRNLAIDELKRAIKAISEAPSIDEIDLIVISAYEELEKIPLIIDQIGGLTKINEQYLAGGGEILTHSLKNKTILIEGLGIINYTNQTKVYHLINNELMEASVNDLFLGMQNVYFYFNKQTSQVDYILINGKINNDIIKVFINKSTSIAGDNDRYHDRIELISSSKMKVVLASSNEEIEIPSNSILSFTISNKKILVKTNQELLFETEEMVLVNPTNTKIKVNSITRSQGKPDYYGRFEIQIVNNRLQLVNNVNLEDYLKTVVPSEMPSSWQLEALKAQSISARTYALADVFKTTYFDLGYHVDDSVMSQVYNNTVEQSSTNRAIMETKGIVMKSNGELISAVFFSTSSSATGLPGDAWFEGTMPKPNTSGPYNSAIYAKDFNGNDIVFDIENEASMLAFYQLINFDTFEKNSAFHRWLYHPSKTEVINQLQVTLNERYNAAPNQVLTYVSGQYLSVPIPSDLGTFVDLLVHERGAGGLITSIDIVTSKGRFRVYKEYNIRLLFRNITFDTATANQQYYNGTRSNFSFLPSAYFAIEIIGNTVNIYGGGWGHGTGMSQYGANEMANREYNYEDILTFYFHNITFETWIKETPLPIDLINCFNKFV